MPTVTYQVQANADDGSARSSSFDQYEIFIGNNGGYSWINFVRFINVDVPQGATIVSAKLQFRALVSSSDVTVNSRIHFNAADNATAPTTYSNLAGKAQTTASVDWNNIGAWTTGTWYDTPDIKDVVQEIVNRAGWVSGNAMMAILPYVSSTLGRYRQACDYYDGAAYAPKLVVEYTAGGTDVSVTAATAEASAEALAATPHADVLVVGATAEATAEALAANSTTALIVLGAVAEAIAEALPATPHADVVVQASVAESTAEALPATAIYNVHVTVQAATAEASAEALPAEPFAQRNITVEAAIGTATAEAFAAVARAGRKLYWIIKYQ